MIDWNTDSPPWQRVAEAGFGQAMEDCGFRKVGRTMWRRDGDRIAWRVALTKGYADEPGSFRASYGGFVKEIDELVKLYNPKRWLCDFNLIAINKCSQGQTSIYGSNLLSQNSRKLSTLS